jgi:1-acyl-sn-glycerol-3-phosphate acyltransferase
MTDQPVSVNKKPGLMNVMVSCYFWFSLFFISGVFFPFFLLLFAITAPFDKNRFIMHKATCIWSDVIITINPYWKVKVEGKNKIDPGTVYVMVSNHQSGADILVLFKLYSHFKWIAKKELFYIPFIGWNMGLNGYISLERSRGRSKLQMMDKAAEAIKNGNSVLIFPEGTRSKDGHLQPFKSGAFRLALETKCDILPIAIKGTYHAIKKGGLLIHKNKDMRAVILDPVPYESVKEMESKELANKVHEIIRKDLNR